MASNCCKLKTDCSLSTKIWLHFGIKSLKSNYFQTPHGLWTSFAWLVQFLKEVIRTTRLKNHFRPKPQEIFEGKNLNRKTNVESKTIGQEKASDEEVLNSSTEGKQQFQEGVWEMWLFCKPKSEARWTTKTRKLSESCTLKSLPVWFTEHLSICLALNLTLPFWHVQ